MSVATNSPNKDFSLGAGFFAPLLITDNAALVMIDHQARLILFPGDNRSY